MLYFKAKGNVSNMTQENQFILSCYQHIADLNVARNIFIVQHKQTHKLYVVNYPPPKGGGLVTAQSY